MTFSVFLHPKAARPLERLDNEPRTRIKNSLKQLESSPETQGEHLTPSPFWRIRIDDYRAIYEIDTKNNRVSVLFIGDRSKVYDDFARLI